MYLEVTNGEHRPVTYRLSRPEIAVGSLNTNDIILTAPAISKKHLKILYLEDRWFIQDEGSTNGSYFKDQQLKAGIVTEFPLDTELRLGDEVFMRLVDHPQSARVLELEEPGAPLEEVFPDLAHQEKTRHISVEEFRAAELAAVERKRIQIMKQAKYDKAFIKMDRKLALKLFGAVAGVVVSAIVLEYTWRSFGNVARDEFIKLPKNDKSWSWSGSK